MSVGADFPGGVEAANSLSQASACTRVMQPASKTPNVFNTAREVVCVLFSGSWITVPHPPVVRSTRLGTLPAAIFRPSACPLSVSPLRNCAPVHTDATVVSSLMVTSFGAEAPNVAISAIAGFAPWEPPIVGCPPLAVR